MAGVYGQVVSKGARIQPKIDAVFAILTGTGTGQVVLLQEVVGVFQ